MKKSTYQPSVRLIHIIYNLSHREENPLLEESAY